MPISFSTLLASATLVDGATTVEVPADWMQGRSVFGGLQAALAVRAMRSLVPDAPLRALQTTFVAPVPAGVVRARARVLRIGQSATHVEARIEDGANTLAVVVGVFGRARSSVVAVVPKQPAIVADHSFELQFVPGVFPAFIQHFTARWLRGQPPFSGATATQHVVEVGMRDEAPASESHVIAIADFIPPLALTHLRAPANGSTVTWMLELVADQFDRFPISGWRVDAELVAARDGYTSQSVMLWAPDGTPAAISRQSMLVFG
jgi:acyl-CoA thioesterase